MDNQNRHFLALTLIASCILICYSAGCVAPKPEARDEVSPNFPNNVGSFWVYEVFDSNDQLVDTARVEIVGTIQIKPEEVASVWKHQKSDSVWYRYVRVHGNRVIEYPRLDGVGASTLYRFPISVGDSWSSNPAWNDYSEVMAVDSSTHPAFHDRPAFYIVRHWETPVSVGNHDTWLIPDVGIIKSNLFSVSGVDSVREKWELIECSVVEDGDSVNPSFKTH